MSGTALVLSPARTILVVPASALRGARVTRIRCAWPAKDQAAALDYALDLSSWMIDATDTIAGSPTIAFSPSGDLNAGPTIVNGLVVGWVITGGQPSMLYDCAASVKTTAGRLLVEHVGLYVLPTPALAPVGQPVLIGGAQLEI